MKRFTVLICLVITGLTCTVGCSNEELEAVAGIYDAVIDIGEAVYTGVDEKVHEYEEKQGSTSITIDTPSFDSSALGDLLGKKFSEEESSGFEFYEDNLAVTGENVLALLSSAKSAHLTVLIQFKDEELATVNGYLITMDNAPYVEGINELSITNGEYLYDFCGYNGIIPSVIRQIPSRKFVVYQYGNFNSNITKYKDIQTDAIFDILTLVDDQGKTCGFYCLER